MHQTHGFPSPAAELGQREVSPALLPEFSSLHQPRLVCRLSDVLHVTHRWQLVTPSESSSVCDCAVLCPSRASSSYVRYSITVTQTAVTLCWRPGRSGNHVCLALCPDFDSFQAIYNPEVTAKRVREQEAFLTLFGWKSQGTVVQVSRDFLSWLRL